MKIAVICLLLVLILIYLFIPQKEDLPTQILSKQAPPTPCGDRTVWKQRLPPFIQKKIQSVYYAIVNYQDRPYAYRGFHTCDKGILIEFTDGKWLNWVWEEEGAYGQPEMQLSFEDMREAISDDLTEIVEVGETDAWKPFMGKPLSYLSANLHHSANEETYLSELDLTFGKKRVVICATEEPDPYHLPQLNGLPYGQDWMVVVFDEEILKKNRGG